MPVQRCLGCQRFISISVVAGGNPVAAEDAERWAGSWRGCRGCVRLWCERCAPSEQPNCPRCSEPLLAPPVGETFARLYLGGVRAWLAPTPPSSE